LQTVLKELPPVRDPNVLVGVTTGDDCAVYRITDDLAIIQTVDYFTPIVDDPYDYGAIAVANSLSDVYAMGAKPLFALNMVGFHAQEMSLEILIQMMRGGGDKAREAGIDIIGGHTIDDKEPKYGLAVTGVMNPDDVVLNSTARVGDALIVTKPIGSGIISTALKRGIASEAAVTRITEVMATLNKSASETMVAVGVSACTDISGYGLLGHLGEMTRGSSVGARIHARAVPVVQAARDYIDADLGIAPGGTKNNLEFAKAYTNFDPGVTQAERLLLADAQTSGGLLIACPGEKADELEAALRESGVIVAARIGVIEAEDDTGRIDVVP
jgi:selenide,water dikinase